ncbi:type 1 glycerol-3-phosphate oxidase [Latilactobacillus curvatus]|jgi:alpha-glycerophosphate oxidase|uniref:Alpha-glycerophosphate oxidase n=1 Tax=Latilactobacillus curvatus TaxID=28038 RepID=A0AAJ5REA4_LATCU|nr:type 1 glycerol-3-phosphate oxidase [Latilactobacillus curvatus]MBZ1503931.1 type 1 glycerol-3-phosphate oxidase [Latilactobacillus curvatus]MCP8849043.1 type 1 glycerol-3-phosphate oxidase [Latilactobacillus curvatus]MCT3358078.1 type 1 glycerol-3-phosphate oxidase [Latilactobacillus curvatus]MDG2982378.1 type 1 glycerol-3-phosphate oxidase [Latilactobacillus curvatus]UTB76472.1 alpha-glycerophosphate oxidase [Latilactobacillus curvatus]
MTFSLEGRQQVINNLKNEQLDLLVIGGGITGAGVAIQAAASGIKTGLIEMQDFAEGTSSRSTKLVHGGIRYLKTFDVGVVADTVSERAVVQGIAPHIPRPTPMLLPIYDEPEATYDMFSVKIAMDLYDKLAGVTGTQYANYTIDRKEVLQREPGLKSDRLMGAGVYLDFVNNDARLVIENIKEADELGASIASHVKAVGMTYDANGRVNGLKAHDELTDETFDIHAKLVINTAGPWVDKVNALNTEVKAQETLRPTKGIHLVVDSSRLSVPQPTYFDSGLHDGRMIFVVPREGKTYFGTTDTDYTGDFKHPRVEQADVDYLLKAINNRYPSVNIALNDIEASWAGLRPLISNNGSSDYNGGGANSGKVSEESFNNLIKTVDDYENKTAARADVEKAISQLRTAHAEESVNPSQVSRGSDLKVAENGLITLSGGKITDYRKMAAGALELIRDILKKDFNKTVREIDSKKLQVSGGHFDPNNVDDTLKFYAKVAMNKGIDEEDAIDLANRFGSNVSRVVSYADQGAAEGLNLKETISLRYSVNEEMTLTPVDYLLRRTNFILFHNDQLAAIKQPVVDEMARLLNWDDAEKARQTELLDSAIAEAQLDYLK